MVGLDDVGRDVLDVLLCQLGMAALGRHVRLPRVAGLVSPAIGDDADEERRVERRRHPGQLFDRVERGTDAALQARAMANGAVLGV